MTNTEIKNLIKTTAENDAVTFVSENEQAFDQSSGSGEFEVISVRETLNANGIDYKEIEEELYDELLSLYSDTITETSETIIANQ